MKTETAIATATLAVPPTTNKHLIRWVEKMADLCQPDHIHWVDGSQAEYDFLCDQLVEAGTFTHAEPEALARLLLRPLRRPTTSPASKTAPSSARSPRTTPAPPTTGKTPS